MFHDGQGKDGKGIHCLRKDASGCITFGDKEVNKDSLYPEAS
jgi:hypothetical protein